VTGRGYDLVFGFRLTMEEVARHRVHLEEAAVKAGNPIDPGMLPLDVFRGLGFAVHTVEEAPRTVLVGWSLLPPEAAGPAAPVNRARLVEADGKVKELLEALKLQKPTGYHVASSWPADSVPV